MNELELTPPEQLDDPVVDDVPAASTASPEAPDYSDFLMRARQCYEMSTSYIESDIRTNWARDIANFQSRHPPESKFNSPDYAMRNRTFRPKTRMAAAAAEAATAASLFNSMDLLDVQALDPDNPEAVAGAEVRKQLLKYRLENTIPWFQTVMGARQDCFTYGLCASYQCWKYETLDQAVPLMGPDGKQMTTPDGQPAAFSQRRTLMDEPCIELIPPENLRFDPECDWRNPVKSSSFLIRVVPMYLEDVKARMASGEWIEYADATIRATMSEKDLDSTERERQHGRPVQQIVPTYNPMCYAHENFVMKDGVDYVFWTLGTELLLSEPKPRDQVYATDERPIVVGVSVIETHRTYPTSDAGLGAHLQAASNEIANQRLDNVALVLNKRYVVRRGRQIDLGSLMRNVPGGGIVTDDPNADVRILETPDVTSSAYGEQDRLDVQFDEITGTFSGSSVQSNRALNETVGGMNLMSGGASAVTDYRLRTFVETWVEPVLRQLDKLEMAYETDETVLAVAGRGAKETLMRFGMDRITDEMLMANATIRINVGMGATNPEQKVQKIMTALQAVGQLPEVGARINPDAVIAEVFGAMGFRNGKRFILPAEEVQQAEAPPPDPMVEVKMAELELDREKLAYQRERDAAMMQLQERIGMAQVAVKADMSMAQLQAKLDMKGMDVKTQRDKAALQATIDLEGQQLTRSELRMKRIFGEGI